MAFSGQKKKEWMRKYMPPYMRGRRAKLKAAKIAENKAKTQVLSQENTNPQNQAENTGELKINNAVNAPESTNANQSNVKTYQNQSEVNQCQTLTA